MAVLGGISVSRAGLVSGGIVEILREAVLAGELVKLPGLGAFRVSVLKGEAWDPQRKVRVGRSKRVVRFKGREVEARSGSAFHHRGSRGHRKRARRGTEGSTERRQRQRGSALT